jgi:hypothetical protein
MYKLDQSISWNKLEKLAVTTSADRIADYFAADAARFFLLLEQI